MTSSIELTSQRSPVEKAKRQTIILQDITIDGFMLPTGEYVLSQTQVSQAIGKDERSSREFIQSNELKFMLGLSLESAIQIDRVSVEGANKPIVAIPLRIAGLYWIHWSSRNKKAKALTMALANNSLLSAFDAAFGIDRTLEERQQQLQAELKLTAENMVGSTFPQIEEDDLKIKLPESEQDCHSAPAPQMLNFVLEQISRSERMLLSEMRSQQEEIKNLTLQLAQVGRGRLKQLNASFQKEVQNDVGFDDSALPPAARIQLLQQQLHLKDLENQLLRCEIERQQEHQWVVERLYEENKTLRERNLELELQLKEEKVKTTIIPSVGVGPKGSLCYRPNDIARKVAATLNLPSIQAAIDWIYRQGFHPNNEQWWDLLCMTVRLPVFTQEAATEILQVAYRESQQSFD